MELIRLHYNQKLQLDRPTVAVIGQFDGIHIGHMSLIDQAKQIATKEKMQTAVITFDPHPDYILHKRPNEGYITPLSQKIKIFESLDIDLIIMLHFDLAMSQMDHSEFFKRFLLPIQVVIVGTDYRYGHFGQGDASILKTMHPRAIIMEDVCYENKKIGSDTIREWLIQGDVEKIHMLLNRYYEINGIVHHGSQVGRTLGIKTANVDLTEAYQIIKGGVYAVYVTYQNRTYLGVCNIGYNPTLNRQDKMRLEVHILDFDEDIYEQPISIAFLKRIRDELMFDNREALIKQIQEDIALTKKQFGGKQ